MQPKINGRAVKPYLTAEEVKGMSLGTCCACGGSDNVVHLLNLNGWCPILGRGWGCLACKLPPHGAVAVVCNACIADVQAQRKPLVWICTGHPTRDGRTPAGEMVAGFDHDLAQHIAKDGGF